MENKTKQNKTKKKQMMVIPIVVDAFVKDSEKKIWLPPNYCIYKIGKNPQKCN